MSSDPPSPTPTPTPTPVIISTLISTISSVITATTTQTVYGSDPYLEYQPAFAYSLPIQFLVTGVIVSLCAILLIHLVFTAPYHWPMAKLNYVLQLSGVSALLLSLGITLSVILSNVHGTSREWPYMLNYVAVDMPLANWTMVDSGLWYSLDAVTSGLAHTTHIQFLTYLYPAPIERKLIVGMLGPIVLISSLSSFLELSSSASTRAIADSVKNICNSALAILFSVALGVWGLLINRKEAWRTDGGTAIFGGGAIALSLFTMGLNLYQIAKVPPVWFPPLLWVVVLWQSFLGWWWYLGSDAPEPPSTRALRKKDKRKAKANAKGEDGTNTRLARMRTRLGLTDGLRRRKTRPSGSESEVFENTEETTHLTAEPSAPTPFAPPIIPSPPAAATNKSKIQASLIGNLPTGVTTFLSRLRTAHQNAVEQQAVENEIKRFEVYGGAGVRGVSGSGWGLGSYAIRGETGSDEGESGVAWSRRLDDDAHVAIPMRDMGDRNEIEEPGAGMEDRRVVWEDEEVDAAQVTAEGRREKGKGGERVPMERLSTPNSSWSWFGPFRRWRLRDVSVFS